MSQLRGSDQAPDLSRWESDDPDTRTELEAAWITSATVNPDDGLLHAEMNVNIIHRSVGQHGGGGDSSMWAGWPSASIVIYPEPWRSSRVFMQDTPTPLNRHPSAESFRVGEIVAATDEIPDAVVLDVRESTWSRLERFRTASLDADPLRVSGFWGRWLRMFYFSAVTITTLGFGDIAPLSTTARVMVATEAILGVVAVGLFLNSLSRERPPQTVVQT